MSIHEAQINAIMDLIDKQIEETKVYANSTCLFGVGLPSAIASVRTKMINELLQTMTDAREEWREETKR
tara:strand:- start:784 stop:990 length:207 start_codon:yes stop_codon:yes gene_type:complete